jgi:hypothetical protein
MNLFSICRALGGIADVAAWGAVLSILMKLFPAQVRKKNKHKIYRIQIL